ncbi:transcriptional regulator [Rhodanobacter glycinis]|uniref:transcriptional regulator n=1 Tax=Rhodanobacter glycinis TaxID=582702 RepID=UPI00112E899C|nr:YdaS family helix-turn-helix protein [Rhodanobacter glycinis]TPG50163.1 transcriptional regulator [Rhodanobacter glycinis]
MKTEAINTAVKVAGGQTALAARIGVSQGLVWQWTRGQAIATKHFAAIERETGVTAHQLLADELAKIAAKSVPS